ncbi:hypothetical protein LOK49_LG13G00825 [Camellia lanceoleosa]|uniref:Uncharacterized protein n=1 Tax=Camellia lanceoleosa TaxID=1840588 RepID=A0ACC0FK19_9ERIC|nr:hypothetical protein LOK49_LG13G00825 [Camellia lanceoleosa]
MNAEEDVLLHGLADNDTFLKQMRVNSHTGEGMDCSNSATQWACESSTKKKDKKRSRFDDDVVEELFMFADKLVDVMGKTNEKLEFIRKMMGYSHHVASKRASLNDELTKFPITVDKRLDACKIKSNDVQKLDMFFSLIHDDRLRWVMKLLKANAKEADQVSDQFQSTSFSDATASSGGSTSKQEVKHLPGGKIKKKDKQVVIEKVVRNRRKCITTVKGLDLFGAN